MTGDRENRLSFATNSTARYRGREREIVMEVFPEYAAVRLLGDTHQVRGELAGNI